MANTTPKLLAALGAAAFLIATPVAAQNSGGAGAEVYPELGVFFERLNPDKHRDVHQRFTGLGSPAAEEAVEASVGGTVPQGIATYPVPEEIYEVMPETRNYEYFMMSDDRVALVHPETNTIEVILE
ncbi:MAG: hypothetical protein ACOC71_08520 [Hyphomicrobiales bacterium]